MDFSKHIKDDDHLKTIPVVFLSTSDSDMDAIAISGMLTDIEENGGLI